MFLQSFPTPVAQVLIPEFNYLKVPAVVERARDFEDIGIWDEIPTPALTMRL